MFQELWGFYFVIFVGFLFCFFLRQGLMLQSRLVSDSQWSFCAAAHPALQALFAGFSTHTPPIHLIIARMLIIPHFRDEQMEVLN